MNETEAGIFRSLEDINFILLVATVVVAGLLLIAIDRLFDWLREHLRPSMRTKVTPWGPVLRVVVIALSAVQVLVIVLEPTAENLIAVVGGAALGISFALRDYLSGLIAGLVILFERPYRTGDWITVGGNYGEVRHIGFRSTTLMNPDDTQVVVSNSAIWTDEVKNSTNGQQTLQVVAEFAVRKRHDYQVAATALEDVAFTSALIDITRETFLTLKEENWAAVYRLKAYPRESSDQFALLTDLYGRGRKALTQRGIEPVETTIF